MMNKRTFSSKWPFENQLAYSNLRGNNSEVTGSHKVTGIKKRRTCFVLRQTPRNVDNV